MNASLKRNEKKKKKNNNKMLSAHLSYPRNNQFCNNLLTPLTGLVGYYLLAL